MTRRLSRKELKRLGDAVCGSQPTLGPDGCEAARATYQLLRAAGAVTEQTLAATLGWESARAATALHRLPNVEVDTDGAVTGFGGLSVQPTPHRLVIGGQTRYAWCAWDTLFLPVALHAEAEVASSCPHTGRPVTLTVTSTGVRDRDPDCVVLSFVHARSVDTADLRGSFCAAVHFLADASAAEHWTRQAGGRLVLDLDDAFKLGRRMIRERCGLAPGPPTAGAPGEPRDQGARGWSTAAGAKGGDGGRGQHLHDGVENGG